MPTGIPFELLLPNMEHDPTAVILSEVFRFRKPVGQVPQVVMMIDDMMMAELLALPANAKPREAMESMMSGFTVPPKKVRRLNCRKAPP